MYARLTTVQLRPGEIGRVEAVWREHVLPSARQQSGFKGALVLADRNTDKAYSVTLWESEADAEQSMNSGYLREALAKAASLFAGPPTHEHLAVVLDERA